MSDPRERLTALLKDRENWHPHDLRDAVDAILAEFLVVPRDSIVGTEYGYRYTSETGERSEWPTRYEHRADAIQVAIDSPSTKGCIDVLERPVLPWCPIPLPEDGDQP